jgi:hypothetical protein
VVESDAIRRTEELVDAVLEALIPIGTSGNLRQLARVSELDHGGAVGQHDADAEGDDRGHDEAEQVRQLGVERRQARRRQGEGD